ncbi:hypothetical protein [Fusibacter ferrireducens]|uniref:Uncharacterized protein n=1 Tax=Fusibacter ferrireducens TaxID=2785058 RepID=A0ABR9ZNV3_9FIRM|nr:hypothetical protein [Fusibacter ferrireducens]MBF4692140.1 hypothetical protein [Fusibacter ferrireducens]
MKKNLGIILLVLATLALVLWQKNTHEAQFALQEDRIITLEDALLELSLQNEAIGLELKALDTKCGQLEDQLLVLKYDLIHNNLSHYWSHVWDAISKSQGSLTAEQIEEINFLLQPVFSYNDQFEINPLSCFFTSYYEDIRDIDLSEFLRYFPDGESLKTLSEFEALKKHEHWPFEYADSLENLPVPIHRYTHEQVQDVFTTYADIHLESLTGVGFDEIIYLDATEAYYNFTSDFAPGFFNCKKGVVEDGIIKLYGTSRNEAVLTIIKAGEKYVIKSLYPE